MLYKLLDRTKTEIAGLDIDEEAPAMASQIRQARPDFLRELKKAAKGGSGHTLDEIADGVARGALVSIKEIPEVVDLMVAKVKSRGTPANLRCALVGSLAYLVQPHDLIPDGAPGGFGFLDDDILLRASLAQYYGARSSGSEEAKKQMIIVQWLSCVVPTPQLQLLQVAVQGMVETFHLLQMLPPQFVELTTQQVIANPLQMGQPQVPPGFNAPSMPGLGGGRWSGGAYFEGNNVICPGGASLIDGQVFIPD